MKYLKLFEDFKDMYRQQPKFDEVDIVDGLKVHINPQLCNFSGDDILDLYNEFQDLATEYKLKIVDEIDNDIEINQYHISVAKNVGIDIHIFDNITFVEEMIKDDCKSFIQKMKTFGWWLPSSQSFKIDELKNMKGTDYIDITIVFTKEKTISESFSDVDAWDEVQSAMDVYQLYELLIFKYGPIFIDTKREMDDYDGDFNPDHIYEVIEMELKTKNLWEEFLQNWEIYQNEKEEADPFHWKHRKKEMDRLTQSWDNKL